MAGIDRSLAFTALLEHDEEFRTMDMPAGGERISEFLGDWENAGRPPMLDYSREWVAERLAPAKPGDDEIDRSDRHGPGADTQRILEEGRLPEAVEVPAEPVRWRDERDPYGDWQPVDIGDEGLSERDVMDWNEHNAHADQQLPDMEYGE
jgi:hypothetical protein